MKSYKLLVQSKSKTFEDMVTEAINDGWDLHGPTFIKDRTFVQAVTKTVTTRRKKVTPITTDSEVENAETSE